MRANENITATQMSLFTGRITGGTGHQFHLNPNGRKTERQIFNFES